MVVSERGGSGLGSAFLLEELQLLARWRRGQGESDSSPAPSRTKKRSKRRWGR